MNSKGRPPARLHSPLGTDRIAARRRTWRLHLTRLEVSYRGLTHSGRQPRDAGSYAIIRAWRERDIFACRTFWFATPNSGCTGDVSEGRAPRTRSRPAIGVATKTIGTAPARCDRRFSSVSRAVSPWSANRQVARLTGGFRAHRWIVSSHWRYGDGTSDVNRTDKDDESLKRDRTTHRTPLLRALGGRPLRNRPSSRAVDVV